MMNKYRLAGDMSHLLSIIILLYQLQVARNARGISLRTQELYLAVFVTRYLDLLTTFYSWYNLIMKVIFIGSTSAMIYTIRRQEPIRSTYDPDQDSFPHWKFGAAPCFVLAFFTYLFGSSIDDEFDIMELLWIFSIYCEAIAILPQLIVLRNHGEIENLTSSYVFFLGLYRFMYIINWWYRSHHERNYRNHWVVYVCGVVQTLLYVDFFYYYVKSKITGTRMNLESSTIEMQNNDPEEAGDQQDPYSISNNGFQLLPQEVR